MKPLLQKLPTDQDSSFVARTYSTPYFETPWHQHEEYELLMQIGSPGSAFIGGHIGEFAAGDIFLLGKNLPHWFRKKQSSDIGSAIVVQFREDVFGPEFWNLAEIRPIKNLLERSSQGISLSGELKKSISVFLQGIELQSGFRQLSTLMECLHQISISDEVSCLTQASVETFSGEDQERIHQIMEFTMQNFQNKISLRQLADITHQSISAFSHYFKRTTKKNYVQFLTEIRIANACHLLVSSDKSVAEICYESGFHNWSNFSDHFKSITGKSPSVYRKAFRQSES